MRNGDPLVSIFDGHNDVLLHLVQRTRGEDWSFLTRNKRGHLDLPRAREGGMSGGIFAVFPPPQGDKPTENDIARTDDGGYAFPLVPALEPEIARQFTDRAISTLADLESESAGQLVVVSDIDELRATLNSDAFAVVLHFEGAEAIDPDLIRLSDYYEAGLRSLGIVWSRPNAFGHGVPFRYPASPDIGPGLTAAGKDLVQACNDWGIVIDLAHLNEAGFWDVAELSNHPLVVSHAGCHAICPTARNLTDQQIDAIGDSGGLIGINFFVGDLRADGRFQAHTPLDQIARHIDYVKDRIGLDHIAFGSDFDGALIPSQLGDASGLPRLVETLRQRGYDRPALQKICRDNWLRIFETTWARPT